MPTKGFDYRGFMAYMLSKDGRVLPIDLSQTITLSVDDMSEYEWSINTDDMSCTLETKMNRTMMNLFYPWREVRRHLRRIEKERRKRVKEKNQNAR